MPKREEELKQDGGLLRFGESYTSLVLGIVVVIVATVLLLSFVHSKNANKTNTSNLPVEKIGRIDEKAASDSAKVTPTVTEPSPTHAKPTAKLTTAKIANVVTPTVAKKPTATPAVKVSPTPAKAAKNVSPTPQPKKEAKMGEYIVNKGDNLWIIAERVYKSGYNWVDIARVNNLSDPNAIEVGMKLTLPKVQPKMATVTTPKQNTVDKQPSAKVKDKEGKKVEQSQSEVGKKITGTEYTVVRGDNLWNIAIRAYGDGYQWVKISVANRLANPDLIHAGNKLKIPRGK